jgi:hypothetical protein
MKAGQECMAELPATPPSHPPGEWPTSANERCLLQKLSLFRVAAFFIADVGNGLILSCSSEFESSVCSQISFFADLVVSSASRAPDAQHAVVIRPVRARDRILRLKRLRLCASDTSILPNFAFHRVGDSSTVDWNQTFAKRRLELMFANQSRLSVAPSATLIRRSRPSEGVARRRKDLF